MRIMDTIELESILKHRGPGTTSIYMPAHTGSKETRQDPLRWRNLLDQAEEEIVDVGLRRPDARAILEPGRKLLRASLYFRHLNVGLALLLGEGSSHICRAPLEFREQVAVSTRFHVKPLLPWALESMRFYVLALSMGAVRLFAGTRQMMAPLELKNAPLSFGEATRFDELERQLQFHTGTAEHGPAKDRPGAFHGQGVGVDESSEKKRVLRYCQLVDQGVSKLLGNQKPPLLLAAAEPISAIYRQVNSYDTLVEPTLEGNPDEQEPHQLHERAMEALAERLERPIDQAVARFAEWSAKGKGTSDLGEALAAAHDDRIEMALVNLEEDRWGRYDPDSGKLDWHDQRRPGDEDLLTWWPPGPCWAARLSGRCPGPACRMRRLSP